MKGSVINLKNNNNNNKYNKYSSIPYLIPSQQLFHISIYFIINLFYRCIKNSLQQYPTFMCTKRHSKLQQRMSSYFLCLLHQ